MHVDSNFVVAKGRERTLDHPEVFQSESFDLCEEICLFLRRNHRSLHLAAANRWTLRPHSGAKNLPSVDATFHEAKLAAAPKGVAFSGRESTALGKFGRRSPRSKFHQKIDEGADLER